MQIQSHSLTSFSQPLQFQSSEGETSVNMKRISTRQLFLAGFHLLQLGIDFSRLLFLLSFLLIRNRTILESSTMSLLLLLLFKPPVQI